MSHFKNKGFWGIILGASSGFGLATAKKMAAEGINLCLVHWDRRKELPRISKEFELLKKRGIRVLSFNVDALKKENRNEMLESLKNEFQEGDRVRFFLHSIARGNLKLMQPVNGEISEYWSLQENKTLAESFRNLEIAKKKSLDLPKKTLDSQDFALTIHSMAISLYDWVKDIYELDLFANDARVFGLTSEGNQKALHGYAAVSSAKAALEAICRSIALEYAPFGIRCNILQPGTTDTPALKAIPGSEQLKAHALLRNPFSRLTKPEDVANVIYLLCREEAAWINGALIAVDGGEKIS